MFHQRSNGGLVLEEDFSGILYSLTAYLLWFWFYTNCNLELDVSEPTVCISRKDWVGVFPPRDARALDSPQSLLSHSLQLICTQAPQFLTYNPSPFSPSPPPPLPPPPPFPSPPLPQLVRTQAQLTAHSSHSTRSLPSLHAGHFPPSSAPVPQPPQLGILSLLCSQPLSHLHLVPFHLEGNLLGLDITLRYHPISFFHLPAEFVKELSTYTPHFLTSRMHASTHCELVSTPITPLLWLESPDAKSTGHAWSSLSCL